MVKKTFLLSLLLLPLMLWMQPITQISAVSVHDVAVIGAKLYHLYRGLGKFMPLMIPEAYPTYIDPIEFHVTVKNEGDFAETFNVTAYCNRKAIDTQNVADLAPGANKTLTFFWRPYLPGYPYNRREAWPYPVYIFSANSTVVLDETDIADNTYVDGAVKVKWPGDTNGDGHVNFKDLGFIGITWQKMPWHPKYDPRADFDGDGYIFAKDLGIIGKNWKRGPLD